MTPTHVTIVPSAGHCDDGGKYTRGRTVDTTAEVDVVDRYVQTLDETLEEFGVSHNIMATRGSPGIMESQRAACARKNSIILELGVGWFENTPKRNHSEVYYGADVSRQLAQSVAETIGDWGRCTCFSHVTGTPKKSTKPILCVAGTMGIRIEPFALNGPNYNDYLPRVAPLGRYIAITVSEFIALNNESAGYHPFTMSAWAR